jgi:putative ABC transport system permease protein
VLVAGQIGVSLIVLATGFLFLRNLALSADMSPGFDLRHTVRAAVHLPPYLRDDAERKRSFLEEALAELGAIPGIEAVAAAYTLPFTGLNTIGGEIEFPDTGEKMSARVRVNTVTPDFFEAMGIPVQAGSTSGAGEGGGATPVVVNRTFVERYLGNRPAVGAVFHWGKRREIVAVAGPTKGETIGEEYVPELYEVQTPKAADGLPDRLQFVLRSATPPATQVEPVRRALRRVEPAAGIEAATMNSSIGMAFLPSQAGAALMGTIGILGLVLAIVGLSGVMGYTVARRSREIGVRVAVGAGRGDISRMVLGEAAKLVAYGAAPGLLIALFVTKPLAMFLAPGLSPADPLSYGAVVAVLAAAGLLGTLGPLRRALAVDPVISLRDQ